MLIIFAWLWNPQITFLYNTKFPGKLVPINSHKKLIFLCNMAMNIEQISNFDPFSSLILYLNTNINIFKV